MGWSRPSFGQKYFNGGGDGGTGTTATNLDDLTDVYAPSPVTGQVLTYETNRWIAGTAATSGATTLNDLSDVSVTSAASGNFLGYDGSAWVATSLPTETSVEVRTDDPVNPAVGRIWFRSDL